MPEPSVALPAHGLPAGPRSALVIATSTYADPRLRRLRAPARDAADLRAGLNSRYPQVRIGALQELAAWLADPNPSRVVAARAVMQELADEDIPVVAKAARAHLDRYPAAPSSRIVPDLLPSIVRF